MTQIKKDTGVEVILRGDWQRDAVVVPRQPTPARELMDDMSVVYGGQWFQQGSSWILAETAEEARLTAIPEAKRDEESYDNMKALTRSLGPGQWQQLVQKGELQLGQLDVKQRQQLLTFLRLAFYDPSPNAYAPNAQALTGAGVYLALTGSGPTCTLVIVAPMDHDTYNIPYPFLRADGSQEFGIPPPR